MTPVSAGRVDFFVSHSGPDAAWAAWVDQTLRKAGFTTITDLYDFEAGKNFIVQMDEALSRADRVLLLWSPQAQQRDMVEAEWTSAMAMRADRLIPVIVEECAKPAILSSVLHIDLTSCTDGDVAARTLVEGLRRRARPDAPVAFPRGQSTSQPAAADLPVVFPADWSASRVGTRLLTPDKLLLSRGSVQDVLVIEPNGSIKIGNTTVVAHETRKGRRSVSEFVASIGDQSFSFRVRFERQPITGSMRATELVIDGAMVPIVDRR
jgi:hypothetical protein